MLFGSDYGIWEPKWQIEMIPRLGLPGRGVLGLPAGQRGHQAQDPRAQRRQAVRHRGSRGLRRRRRRRRGRCAAGGGVGCSMSEQASTHGRPAAGWVAPRPLRPQRPRVVSASTCVIACSTRSGRSTTPSSTNRSRSCGSSARATSAPTATSNCHLRLPTPQCAPNFAFLMGADSRRAVRAVDGVRNVVIRFEDHYTGDEINSALNQGDGFIGAFPGETDDDDLESLREIFTRKALIGRQGKICEELINSGVPSRLACADDGRAAARHARGHARARAARDARHLGRGRTRRRSSRRTASRSPPTSSSAGFAARSLCGSASRPTAASADRCCRGATSWSPNPERPAPPRNERLGETPQ